MQHVLRRALRATWVYAKQNRTREYDAGVSSVDSHGIECAGDTVRASGWEKLEFYSEGLGRTFGLLYHASHRVIAVCMWVPEDIQSRKSWNDLLEQLYALSDQLRTEKGRPRYVPSRSRKTYD